MLDTTSVLALAGVLLAALVAGGLNVSQSRRDAWLKAWVGQQLLSSELADALAVADLGAGSPTSDVFSLLPLATSAWETHREAVAPFVGQNLWLDIDRAYADIRALNRLAPPSRKNEGDPPKLNQLRAEQLDAFKEPAARAHRSIKTARTGLEGIKTRKPSVRSGPWTAATGVLWLIAFLLAAFGIGIIGVDVYHARPWKAATVVATDDDVAWSLERRFSADIAACEAIDSAHREFRCTITTPTRNSTYAFPAKNAPCQLASAFAEPPRQTSGVANGCNAEALGTIAPDSRLVLRLMETRSEITHPKAAPDEPVLVIRLFKALSHKLLNPSPVASGAVVEPRMAPA
ncbi:MAG TPA: hypothetical protein VKP14_04780 [Gaiellaceae bacterium]|nr:hypothetical protein [Gaiellaceae bacterium]